MKKGKTQILVVDDEPIYIRIVRLNLEARGYQVVAANNGQAAIDLIATEEPDLILLDVQMPGLDGYETCQRIREFSRVPIIMLTARVETADKVKGLDAGADDYVTKPFSADELLARVRAALRRAEDSAQATPQSIFRAGDLMVDLARQRVFVREQEIKLTPTEYRLLSELIKHTGQVIVPAYLLERVWGVGYEGEEQLLRQAIHRLRRKIEHDPDAPPYIETRPGIGYMFVMP
jgi:two-component system KDP operon response regulator KdpE